MADESEMHAATAPGARVTAAPGVNPRVLVFFDYACQFCYLDWHRLKRLRAEHSAELFLVPFELRPQMATEGVTVESLGGAHSERVEEHMRRMAAEGSLDLVFPQFVPNTHVALALGEYGRDLGAEQHERIHEAIFAAYNGRGADIGRRDVLVGVADELGLDVHDVAAALDEGRFDERLDQFNHLAVSLGITATPAALVCNELLIGSRPYQVLVGALERCLVDARTIEKGESESGRHVHEHAVGARAGEEGEPPSITQ